jgi:hypothetical protein
MNTRKENRKDEVFFAFRDNSILLFEWSLPKVSMLVDVPLGITETCVLNISLPLMG